MAFEGVEKRVEIVFSTADKLREKLTKNVLEKILEPVECKIESLLSEEKVDAYLLSASSCFVYDDRVIVKTCGETKLFNCVTAITDLGTVVSVVYTRGTFSFPENQPSPHNDFDDEKMALTKALESSNLKEMTSVVVGTGDSAWHILGAVSEAAEVKTQNESITVELSMKRLAPERACLFYKKNILGSTMTEASGVAKIFPKAKVDFLEFEPCGFSFNGVEEKAISTIHVAPEEASSFASFETFNYEFKEDELKEVLTKVLACFLPQNFTLTILSSTVRLNPEDYILHFDGYVPADKKVARLESGGSIVYHHFIKAV